MHETETGYNGQEIAVIGLSIRVNRAKNIEEFWDNLKNGVELVSLLSEEELLEAGESPAALKNPNYVRCVSILEDREYFDAPFFGYTPREAELLDPQVRVFHECSWEALEDAGIDPEVYPGLIGVYAGAMQNVEWEFSAVYSGKSHAFGGFAASKLTGIRYLCTRLSYNLNLKGPSITMQTACSTGLVAIHMACQALMSGECDAAVVGGITISPHKKFGYLYEEGMIFSPDGHTRTFDAAGKGALFGEGAGVVILKPLDDAAADNDNIYAIIKSSAVNNDGNRKVGFTAPSVEAQVEMMRTAYHLADISPRSITYVEAHGTATPLGDPIEFESLRQAFGTDKRGFCRIGSVKTNVGHLDAAAGIVGFIKAVLALKYKEIPPNLFFEIPNPEINIIDSPFVVNTRLSKWERGDYPLRAAVNSLGMGGTNAHVVLEEPPQREKSSRTRDYQLLLLSAKSKNALDKAAENLTGYFKKNLLNPVNPINPGITLANVTYTLQTRRKKFKFRRSLVCRDVDEAIDALAAAKNGKVREHYSENDDKKIVFMFPGQGTRYINMGLDLYRGEEIFRREMDRCFGIIKPYIGIDIKEILYPSADNIEKAKEEIDKVEVTSAVVFIIEYALARLLMEWGIKPDAVIGHSFGEYTAACLAGVFSLEDALKLITFRNMLMSQLPPGTMMSVPLPAHQLKRLLNDNISLAVDNGESCIVSGSKQAIHAFEKEMKTKKYICQHIRISVVCHSRAMNSIFDEFQAKIGTLRLNPPRVPFISNVTGTWITDDEALNPAYWANHLRKTVRFADGIKELAEIENPMFLEVGPGNVLSGIAFQYLEKKTGTGIINLLKHPNQDISDISFLLDKIGRLWLYGINFEWPSFYSKEIRHCVYIPPYAFDKERYWLEDIPRENFVLENKANKKPHIRDWFYVTSWTPESQLKWSKKSGKTNNKYNWLIFLDDGHIGGMLCKKLEPYSFNMVTVKTGQTFSEIEENQYIVNPGNDEDYGRLLDRLKESGIIPQKIVHLWGVTGSGKDNINGPLLEPGQNRGFYSLLFLTRALVTQTGDDKLEIIVVTDNMQKVTGDEIISPVKSTVLGPVLVIPQEQINIGCRSIDISLSNLKHGEEEGLIGWLASDLLDATPEKITAYRNGRKWKPSYQHVQLDNDSSKWTLKEKGVYLVTGGTGGIGFTLAEEFAKACKARLLFVGRTELPGREEWDHWISSHDEQNPVSRKIKKIRLLEKIGSEVLYSSANVSDLGKMQQVITHAEERFGAINGIIHAAGGTKGESTAFIRYLDRSKCQHQFEAKLAGLMVLDQLFKDKELDFVLLISSMASFLGGWEYAAYTAGNLFMDRFILEADKWISVNLDPVNLYGDKNTDTSLTIDEMNQAFKYILANIEKGQILLSVSDLHTRIEKASRPLQANETKDSEAANDTQEKKTAAFFPRPHLTTPYIPPTDEIEAGLVEICRQLFGYDKIGIMDNFFELGGTSLTLIRFISEIQGKFDVRLHVQDVFDKEHIRELSKYIKEAEKEKYLSIEPVEQKEYYPLASAQKRLYVIQQLEENPTAYNIPWPFELRGILDKRKLEELILKIIRRHESLRTSFNQVDGEPVQKIQENVQFEISYKEAADVSEVNEIIRDFIRPFDLSLAPLLRAALIELEENHHVLMIDIHHIICDWHSMIIFQTDFTTLYMGEQFPPLRLQYRDYSQWQHNETQREATRKQEEYWLKQFMDKIPVLNLPTDFRRPEFHDFEGERIGFEIDSDITGEIRKILSQTGTTLFMVLLTVYTTLLFIYTGQEDIVVGVPSAGRNHRDLENIVGMFVNMLPMRNNPRPEKTFQQFLKEVKENSIQDFENQDYPFEELVSKLNLPRQSNRTPLVETMLTNLGAQRTPGNETGTAGIGLEARPWQYDKYPAKFDLALDVLDNDDSIQMWLTYPTRLFKRSTIEKVKKHCVEIFEQVVKNPGIKLREITISHDLAEAGPDFLRDDKGDFRF